MIGAAPQLRLRQLGAYVLGRRIGSGGMASVFAARQIGVRGASRVVAVKVMATALADDPAARRLFEREAIIATRIEHPNVVRTYEVGEANGEIFLAMELVRGASLASLCAHAPAALPPSIAIRIACDVARGLSAVHDLRDAQGALLGVVHQDVTPQNIIVGVDGVAKLLDFGIARIVARDGSRTQTVRGKPAYLAPEQVAMQRIDARTDVYALGAVLSGMLAADTPQAVRDVVKRALCTDPQSRFACVDAMREALIRAREASGIAAAEETDVASWVRAVAPSPPSIAELERELAAHVATDDAYRAEVAAVASLPTLAHRRRRWPILLLAMPLVGLGAWRMASSRVATPGLRLHTPIPGQHSDTAGVHALLTLDSPDAPAWAGVYFDHLTVTVTSGAQRVVVCLTPRAEGQRPLVAPSPSERDADPCADLHTTAFSGVNGVYPSSTFNDDWDLVTNPWELDFDGVAEGAPVSIDVMAAFGGAAAMRAPVGVMHARGEAVADRAFPTTRVVFAPPPEGQDTYWGVGPAHCDVAPSLASWLEIATFASQANHAVACPRDAKGLAYVGALRAVATPTLGTVGRIPADASPHCADASDIVWKSDAIAASGCVTMRLTGRFARCAGDRDGDACATSVRCVPPETDLVVVASDGRIVKSASISCVPAYPEPAQFSLSVDDPSAKSVFLALRRGPAPGDCFFDLYDFAWEPHCQD